MKRKTSSAVIERNKPILKRIEELKSEHPFWGYRKVWAHLVHIDRLLVNKKRIYNLMKQNNLLVKPASEELVTAPASEELVTAPASEELVTTPASEELVTAPASEELVATPASD